MKYSLISIAWKNIENIKNVLNDALNSSVKPDEIIIIINPYNDQDTTEIRNYIKSNKNITRWVDCSDNIGCATAWNLGMAISNNELMVVVNDDCRVGPDTYEKMILTLSKTKVGMVGVEMGGFDVDKIKTPKGFLFGIRKSAVLNFGGFSEIASPLADEVELGLRLASFGYEILHCGDCVWSHIHDISNNPNQSLKYLGKYINIRQNQLLVEQNLKDLQKLYNSKL